MKIIEKYFGADEDDPLVQALTNPNGTGNMNENNNVDITTIGGGLFNLWM